MPIDAFIARWTGREGGAERANYQMFLAELCDALGVPRPDVAGADAALNDYAFERAVRPREVENGARRRIDLYKRGCFILEAKQSRLPGSAKALPLAPAAEEAPLGRRSTARGWDVMMQNARRQAEHYVFLLDADHPAPPFVVICDVGHCLELYADFSGTGRAYRHFPDRQGFRIYLEDLKSPEKRELLARLWRDPLSLDPARESARVTRGVAGRLAEVSRRLERHHPAQDVAHFLMRCIFTMFADDVGLLPQDSFKDLLKACLANPPSFAPLVDELWSRLDEESAARRYSTALRAQVPYFNGNLFRGARAFPLGADEIRELIAAAEADWREVDPAIFGALLEQALDKTERRRLGAHYTPRAYVQRLVEATVMEPLRADWQAALTRAEAATQAGNGKRAVAAVRDFHRKLCATRVLDPACGTGNFLYVALELMKALEGEVLETLARLGEPESMGLDRETVDPHQFLGLELNPRAAAIAELVVWIGYLQQHYRTRSGHPGEPILRAFRNVNFGTGKGFDAVLTWDGFPATRVEKRGASRVETYPDARQPDWPEAEFIVGNPPFIGKGSAMRSALGDAYVEALRRAWPEVNESADFVMYWWERCARLLAARRSVLRRFGLVTTNSISQVFNRRLLERHIGDGKTVTLVFAVPDHPWTKATHESAAVRIAMTVAEIGRGAGRLAVVESEAELDTDAPRIELRQTTGAINPDLSTGAAVSSAVALRASGDISWNGAMLAAKGFVITPDEAAELARLDGDGGKRVLRRFLRGGDLVRSAPDRAVIDFFGLDADAARRTAPHSYQHVLGAVKPERDKARDKTFRENWWLFGRSRPDLRRGLERLSRYIGTTETAKHRVFQFIDASILPDHMIVAIASDDAGHLAVLSSRAHVTWSLAAGGWLGVGNDPRYSKSRCFDPFPFPDPSPALRRRLAAAGEELDALRKAVMEENPDLTITGLYNVVEKLKAGETLSAREEDVRRRGLALVVKELHETIDRLVFEAYGWPRDLSDDDVLERLVALNAERAREEAAGHVRWLRPEFQAPRSGGRAPAKAGSKSPAAVPATPVRPVFPKDPYEHPLAVEAALAAAGRPLGPADLARAFGGRARDRGARVEQALATLALYGRVTALPDGRYASHRSG
ncbi:MAG: class I SAM-dependent DNA methyltransferase [Ancylobacter novellus]|uniref:site-specific DNA-methyltransferase (adenine-specific) n=1 Tax=Ancylobacter novellus TaxID=921 RepID=A0A2W5KKZ0_ANCNO|nr:MAG: class I SAM-dependent DNA methyltransferase [Ancylobacter novellus]